MLILLVHHCSFELQRGSVASIWAQIRSNAAGLSGHKSHTCVCIRAFVSAGTQNSTPELRMRKTELRVSQWKLMAKLSWGCFWQLSCFPPLPLLQTLLPSWGEISACQRSEERLGMQRCGLSTAGLSPPAPPSPPSPSSPSASPFQSTDKSHLKDLPFFCGWWELSDKLGTEVNTRPSPGNREFPACSDTTGQRLWRLPGVCQRVSHCYLMSLLCFSQATLS